MATPESAVPSVIAGRYQILERLGKGGMGTVFRVHDRSGGRDVALKQLRDPDERQAGMFEREFHTLRGLAHPRIIEVYDYGVAEGIPHYTMELLDGRDLRDVAPLPYQQACRYLRDVASSLALLHARQLLHRDLSPRNVRITADDRCKLLDFGALTGFGACQIVVGTPPMIAPEAISGIPLDQRVDLYALGALAYFTLTGRHAYHVRSLRELTEAWKGDPPPPSVLCKEGTIPPALDQLVMLLLSKNPMARPSTAGEVITRLNQIAGLEPDSQELGARSYLLSGASVGRRRERRRLRRRLKLAKEGRGSCVTIQAAEGMGSSRMLTDLGIEAQLAGCLPVGIEAREHRGPHGVAHAIIHRLLMSVPDSIHLVPVSEAPMLARFSDELRGKLQVQANQENFSQSPGELRLRIERALTAWLLAVAKHHAPVLITVGDAQRMDQGSASLLVGLTEECRLLPLMIVLAFDPAETASAPEVLESLQVQGSTLELDGLSLQEVHEMVLGMFGEVPHLERLASWLHRASTGRPGAVMELAHHLVDEGVLRFGGGVWALPRELPEAKLPAGVDQALEQRLARLGDSARTLATAMSIHRGSINLDVCLSLAQSLSISIPHSALEQLQSSEVLRLHEDEYDFQHERVREKILASLVPETRRAVHLSIGHLLRDRLAERPDPQSQLDAGWHLLHGGEELEGAALLASAAQALRFEGDSLASAIPALEAALAVYRRHGRRNDQVLDLLSTLAFAAYYVERRLAESYGEDAVDMYEAALGLRLARRLRPVLGRHLSLYAGLGVGLVRHLLRGQGPDGFRRRVVGFLTCVTSLAGVATISLDAPTARRWAERVEPLAALGRDHAAAIAYRLMLGLATLCTDRTGRAIRLLGEVRDRFESNRPIRDMPEDSYKLIYGGSLYSLGVMECYRDSGEALRCADQLEQLGLTLYAMVADQLRTAAYALRGEVEQAAYYRRRVERYAVRAGTAWQVEIWAPASMLGAFTQTEDVIATKRATEELTRLAQTVPSLANYRDLGRGLVADLAGDAAECMRIMQEVERRVEPRDLVGWTLTLGAWVRNLNRLGRHQEALTKADEAIAAVDEEDLEVGGMCSRVVRERALALGYLGRTGEAASYLEGVITRWGPHREPTVLGHLHRARSLIAVMDEDMALARHHAAEMERWFRPTNHPSLIGICEKHRRELASATGRDKERLFDSLPPVGSDAGLETVKSVLRHLRDTPQLEQRALQLLMEHTDCDRGFLFRYDDGRLILTAPDHGDEPPADEVAALLAEVELLLDDDEKTVAESTAAMSLTAEHTRTRMRDNSCVRSVLWTHVRGACVAYGGVLLMSSGPAPRAPDPRVLSGIATSLLDIEEATTGSTVL